MRSQKRIQRTTLAFSDGQKNEKKILTRKEFLLRFSVTSPKLLTTYLTVYGLKSLSFISAFVYDKKQKN